MGGPVRVSREVKVGKWAYLFFKVYAACVELREKSDAYADCEPDKAKAERFRHRAGAFKDVVDLMDRWAKGILIWKEE